MPTTTSPRWPVIIQGGMGVGISSWGLASKVARAGHLGVVSGTALDSVLARRLQDGDVFDLGDIVLAVLHLPGHSPGSIALWDEARARLFTGDVVYDDELLDEMHGADIDSYIASMRRLLALPVDMVYPGHGEPFPGTRLREIASEYLDRRTD